MADLQDPLATYQPFGPTPEEIKASAQSQATGLNFKKAQLTGAQQAQFQGYQANNIFKGALDKLLKNEDPAVTKAMKAQAVKSAVMSRADKEGVDLMKHPEEYFRLITDEAIKAGVPELPYTTIPMINKLRDQNRMNLEAQAKLAAARAKGGKVTATPGRKKADMLAAYQYANNSWQDYADVNKVPVSDFKKVDGYQTLLQNVADSVSSQEAKARDTGESGFDRGAATQATTAQYMARISRKPAGLLPGADLAEKAQNIYSNLAFKPKYYSSVEAVGRAKQSGELSAEEANRIWKDGFGIKSNANS